VGIPFDRGAALGLVLQFANPQVELVVELSLLMEFFSLPLESLPGQRQLFVEEIDPRLLVTFDPGFGVFDPPVHLLEVLGNGANTLRIKREDVVPIDPRYGVENV
jgi:hypothetical protein